MSDASEPPRADRRARKDALFEAALGHAPFDGWSRKALLAASEEIGVDRAEALRLFPAGGRSLLDWFDHWLDRRAEERLESFDLASRPIKNRVALAVRARLETLSEHREATRRAVGAALAPGGALGRVGGPWRTADWAWRMAGAQFGRQEGFSYYSRRALLASAITATMLYWLEDDSPGAEATWRFLDRRLNDAMTLGRSASRIVGALDRFRPRPRAR